ncbi:hypothetical protein [Clostridium baratii]|uniref:hypothetical protein n=1 Tax=Clostridium baratii TaxID=1561 RepID=UPI002943EF4F|nr:hypothetical protein [Clostridium baratii]
MKESGMNNKITFSTKEISYMITEGEIKKNGTGIKDVFRIIGAIIEIIILIGKTLFYGAILIFLFYIIYLIITL